MNFVQIYTWKTRYSVLWYRHRKGDTNVQVNPEGAKQKAKSNKQIKNAEALMPRTMPNETKSDSEMKAIPT